MLLQEPVAQLVEHVTFNHGVLGSSPSGLTNENNYLCKESWAGNLALCAMVCTQYARRAQFRVAKLSPNVRTPKKVKVLSAGHQQVRRDVSRRADKRAPQNGVPNTHEEMLGRFHDMEAKILRWMTSQTVSEKPR